MGVLVFKRIDHVEIVTDQFERTIEFYTTVLGFKVRSRERVERSGMGVPLDIAYLELGDGVIELMRYYGAAPEPAQEKEHLGYRMMALEVDDMSQTAEYLKTKGVEIVWGPMKTPKFCRAEICDCNGFHIELRQWY